MYPYHVCFPHWVPLSKKSKTHVWVLVFVTWILLASQTSPDGTPTTWDSLASSMSPHWNFLSISGTCQTCLAVSGLDPSSVWNVPLLVLHGGLFLITSFIGLKIAFLFFFFNIQHCCFWYSFSGTSLSTVGITTLSFVGFMFHPSSIYLSIYLSIIYVSIYLSINHLSIYHLYAALKIFYYVLGPKGQKFLLDLSLRRGLAPYLPCGLQCYMQCWHLSDSEKYQVWYAF